MHPRVFAAVATVMLSTGTAWGWGDEAHKIVCEIANGLLTADEQREVKGLVRAFRRPDGERYAHLSTACTFADTARKKAREQTEATGEPWSRFGALDRWHFLNVARETRHLPEENCADCLLDAIAFHRKQLADRTLPPAVRGEALALLGHWVADAHQPLHVSYADDRGGNEIDRLTGIYEDAHNLHDVWDNRILAKGRGARGLRDWRAYARVLGAGFDPGTRARWEASDPRTWADESYRLATEDAFLYCRWDGGACRSLGRERRLEASYQTRFQPVVEERLQQAAVRLAKTIKDALQTP